MIEIVSQPDKWESVYDTVKYVIKQRNKLADGSYAILAGDTATTKKVDLAGITIIPIGDLIEIGGYTYPVLGTSGAYLVISDPTDRLDATGYAVPIYQLTKSKLKFALYAGYRVGNTFASSSPLTKVADIACSANSLAQYTIRIEGYLSELFGKMTPPVIGPDKNLFIHYQLKLYVDYDNDITFNVGAIKFAINGCVEGLNSTEYPNGALLSDDANFKFNSNNLIDSLITRDYVKNINPSGAVLELSEAEIATGNLYIRSTLDGGTFEFNSCINTF